MVGINTHDCSTCALHRTKVPVNGTTEYTIDEDDCRVYNRIQIMLANATQAADPTSLNNLPESVSDSDKKEPLQKDIQLQLLQQLNQFPDRHTSVLPTKK